MPTRRGNALALLGAVAAAGALAAPPLASAAPVPTPQAPCYNGITPFNPYADNCALPSRPPHVLGSAPDQTAILNCSVGGQAWRAVCLSQYVNGGPGMYPGGIVIGIGGR
jgi:hypothetical protein